MCIYIYIIRYDILYLIIVSQKKDRKGIHHYSRMLLFYPIYLGVAICRYIVCIYICICIIKHSNHADMQTVSSLGLAKDVVRLSQKRMCKSSINANPIAPINEVLSR